MPKLNFNKNSRFSEEILHQGDENDSGIFSIAISKECNNQKNEPDFFLSDSKLCWYCYYRELAKVMRRRVPKSKRKQFLVYQANLRKNSAQFLSEIRDFVLDNEAWFDEHDYATSVDYLNFIEEIQSNQQFTFREKIELVNTVLYENRDNSSFLDLEDILRNVGISVSNSEIINIAEFFENENTANVAITKDGASIMINHNGILAFESPEEETNPSAESDIKELFNQLIDYLDVEFTKLRVDNSIDAAELSEMIDDLDEKFNEFSKPALRKIVKMKLAETILTQGITNGVLKPGYTEVVALLTN